MYHEVVVPLQYN